MTEPLRWGFTTGSAATAAALGAVRWLLARPVLRVALRLPDGGTLSIPLGGCRTVPGGAEAWVVKDAGDDPDVTHGLPVVARVRLLPGEEILLEGGEGVGTVTRPGLPVPVGERAINPGPRKMLLQHLRAELPPGLGASVVLSIPGGEEVAARTFNPRLGIQGGLSILGTQGVVRPMSEPALTATIRAELSVRAAEGHRGICLVPGNYGRNMARSLGVPEDRVVGMSNFVGEALEAAADLGFRDLLLVGQVGKFAKLAAGCRDTHSRRSDARLESLGVCAALHGAPPDGVRRILEANTADEAATDLLAVPWGPGALRELADRAARAAGRICGPQVRLGCLIFALPGRELARTDTVTPLVRRLREAPAPAGSPEGETP